MLILSDHSIKQKALHQDLPLIDYGARMYDPAVARWMSPDPLAEKYYPMTPYGYCAENPINLVDPNGAEIEDNSQIEWKRLKQNIQRKKIRLQTKIERVVSKANKKGWNDEILTCKIGCISERVASLTSSIETMETLEGSSQVYCLSHTKQGENGGVTLNISTKVIDIKFNGIANFVHEMTHAGQFETGDIAFLLSTGQSVFQDVYDEIAAYKAQFGYSPSSVTALSSVSVAHSFDSITPMWVQNLMDKGTLPYAAGGSSNTGLKPVNINSSRNAFIQAYPWNAGPFEGLPENFIIKHYQNIYYKR